jgi:hypothetical protein
MVALKMYYKMYITNILKVSKRGPGKGWGYHLERSTKLMVYDNVYESGPVRL